MTAAAMQLERVNSGHILAVVVLITPAMAIIAPAGLALVCVLAGAAVAATRFLHERRLAAIGRWVAWPIAALLLVGGVSSAWAIHPLDTLLMWPLVAAVFLAGLVVSHAARRLEPGDWRRVRIAFTLGLAFGLGLFAVELSSSATVTFALRELTHTARPPLPEKYDANQFNRAATLMAILAWPAIMLALRYGRSWLAAVIPPVVLVVIVWTESAAAVAALLVGGTTFLLARGGARLAPKVVAAVLAGGVIFAPLIVRAALALPAVAAFAAQRNSYGHRLRIWQHTVDLIADKPIFGWGLDAARYLSTGGHGLGAEAELLPLHPHNGALQIWLELGLVGALAAAVLAVTTCIAIERTVPDRAQRAGCLAAVMAAVTVVCLSYGIWQYWWLAGLWIAATVTLLAALGPAKDLTAQGPGHLAGRR